MLGLGFQEILIFGAIAVLLFGKRLPEVARSLGASYQDFRKGLTELQSQMDFTDTIYGSPTRTPVAPSSFVADENDEYDEPTAPKLELPPPDEPAS